MCAKFFERGKIKIKGEKKTAATTAMKTKFQFHISTIIGATTST
jgi:hypothetical protein